MRPFGAVFNVVQGHAAIFVASSPIIFDFWISLSVPRKLNINYRWQRATLDCLRRTCFGTGLATQTRQRELQASYLSIAAVRRMISSSLKPQVSSLPPRFPTSSITISRKRPGLTLGFCFLACPIKLPAACSLPA